MTTFKDVRSTLNETADITVTQKDIARANGYDYTPPARKEGESRLSYMIRLTEGDTKPVSGDVNADGKVYDPECQAYV